MFNNTFLQKLKAGDNISLELIDDKHVKPLLQLINANRLYLRQWLPWVDKMQTTADLQAYINQCKMQHGDGTDAGFVIYAGESIAGRIGVHYIHPHNKYGAIGYWLGEEFTGKGIITKACSVLINHCFKEMNLNRIEIKCAVNNHKSEAIPKRLNFKFEGILRRAEFVNGEFFDLKLYSLLKEEWKGYTS